MDELLGHDSFHRVSRAAAAREHYLQLLAGNEIATDALYRATAADRGLTFAGRSLVHTLLPHFVDEDTYKDECAAAENVGSALLRVVARLTVDRSLAVPLGINLPNIELLIRALAGWPGWVGRLDGLTNDAGTTQFIEYNPSAPGRLPGGMELQEDLFDAFASSEAMQDTISKFSILRPHVFPQLLHELRRCRSTNDQLRLGLFADAAPSEDCNLHARSHDQAQEERLLKFFGSCGLVTDRIFATDIGPPEGRDWQRRSRINLAYPVAWQFYERLHVSHPVLRGLVAGTITPIDGYPLGEVLYDKGLFHCLSVPEWTALLPANEAAACRRHVPWTRILSPAQTTEGDRRSILSNRTDLVVKPRRGFGGEGVVLGWRSNPSDWRDTIMTAIARNDSLVQSRVRLVPRSTPIVHEGRAGNLEMHYDRCVFLAQHRRAVGMLVRASPDEVLNVSRGKAGCTAVAVVP